MQKDQERGEREQAEASSLRTLADLLAHHRGVLCRTDREGLPVGGEAVTEYALVAAGGVGVQPPLYMLEEFAVCRTKEGIQRTSVALDRSSDLPALLAARRLAPSAFGEDPAVNSLRRRWRYPRKLCAVVASFLLKQSRAQALSCGAAIALLQAYRYSVVLLHDVPLPPELRGDLFGWEQVRGTCVYPVQDLVPVSPLDREKQRETWMAVELHRYLHPQVERLRHLLLFSDSPRLEPEVTEQLNACHRCFLQHPVFCLEQLSHGYVTELMEWSQQDRLL